MNKIHVQKDGKCIHADLLTADGVYLRPQGHSSLLTVRTVQQVVMVSAIYGLRTTTHCFLCIR